MNSDDYESDSDQDDDKFNTSYQENLILSQSKSRFSNGSGGQQKGRPITTYLQPKDIEPLLTIGSDQSLTSIN